MVRCSHAFTAWVVTFNFRGRRITTLLQRFSVSVCCYSNKEDRFTRQWRQSQLRRHLTRTVSLVCQLHILHYCSHFLSLIYQCEMRIIRHTLSDCFFTFLIISTFFLFFTFFFFNNFTQIDIRTLQNLTRWIGQNCFISQRWIRGFLVRVRGITTGAAGIATGIES